MLAAVFTVLLSNFASAMWALIPLDELVQDSDLIVVGTLGDVSEYSSAGTDYGQGTIVVNEVIWGDTQANEVLTLKWQNSTGVVCPRVEHSGEQGKKAIWLLTKRSGDEVRADYPSRFVELADRAKVERILRRKNVCLQVPERLVSAAEPAIVSIVFRNPSEHPAQFPGMLYVNGVLYTDADASLSVSTNFWNKEQLLDWKRVEWIPNRVVVADNIAAITVQPKQDYRLSIDLRDLVNISPGENYQVGFEARGWAAANRVRISVQEPADRGSAVFSKHSTGSHNGHSNKVAVVGSLMIAMFGICMLLVRKTRHHRSSD
jgi:hypothetical protein